MLRGSLATYEGDKDGWHVRRVKMKTILKLEDL